MKFSQLGLALIKDLEGFRSDWYYDSAGLPTTGYGTLIDSPEERVYLDRPITVGEAEQLLKRDLWFAEMDVQRYVTSPLRQCQYDALVLFVYNIGASKFKSSTLLKKVNSNPDDPEIRGQFIRWVFARGEKSDGLLARREKEADLYFSC